METSEVAQILVTTSKMNSGQMRTAKTKSDEEPPDLRRTAMKSVEMEPTNSRSTTATIASPDLLAYRHSDMRVDAKSWRIANNEQENLEVTKTCSLSPDLLALLGQLPEANSKERQSGCRRQFGVFKSIESYAKSGPFSDPKTLVKVGIAVDELVGQSAGQTVLDDDAEFSAACINSASTIQVKNAEVIFQQKAISPDSASIKSVCSFPETVFPKHRSSAVINSPSSRITRDTDPSSGKITVPFVLQVPCLIISCMSSHLAS